MDKYEKQDLVLDILAGFFVLGGPLIGFAVLYHFNSDVAVGVASIVGAVAVTFGFLWGVEHFWDKYI